MFSNEYRLVVKNEKKKQHRMKLNLMTRGMEERERERMERTIVKRQKSNFWDRRNFTILPRAQTFADV